MSSFAELTGFFPIRPLKTEAELKDAKAIVATLTAQGGLSYDESVYRLLLAVLIGRYEAVRSQYDLQLLTAWPASDPRLTS